MVMCGKPAGPDVPDVPDEPDTPIVDPETPDPDTLVPQEVKNGDRILVTNPVIEKFITTVKYTERDYTYSAKIELKTGGDYGYTFRVMPKHPMILDPENLNLIKWITT